MSYKISKELFEAVCGFKVEWIRIEEQGDYVFIVDDVNCSYFLDSFFFKCKEWAYKNSWEISSGTISSNNGECDYIADVYPRYAKDTKEYMDNPSFDSTSEQQAVFDATSWVLEQTKNNK